MKKGKLSLPSGLWDLYFIRWIMTSICSSARKNIPLRKEGVSEALENILSYPRAIHTPREPEVNAAWMFLKSWGMNFIPARKSPGRRHTSINFST